LNEWNYNRMSKYKENMSIIIVKYQELALMFKLRNVINNK